MDQALRDEILAIRCEHTDYGYRRIHLELKNRDRVVNKKKVQRLVQVMDLYNLEIISYVLSNHCECVSLLTRD
ncbi:IS3 family transposase [Ezakiella coagulans]|uniref:IS3 family transposase n=1 Tax=Ezakiella coagulans TaxID=46507 RepID=UPI0035CF8FA9